jgi:hypothetical protein
MLDTLSYEDFAAQIGTKFAVMDAPVPLELELAVITERQATTRQEYFSLIFRGSRDFVLPQRIYQLEHEQLGAGALFLVPISANADAAEYEAAFNRLIGD